MTRRLLAVALVVAFLGACGGGGDDSAEADAPKTTTTLSAEQSREAVKAMWTGYFKGDTAIDAAVATLENGETHRTAIKQQQDSGATKGLTVVVKDVQLVSPKL